MLFVSVSSLIESLVAHVLFRCSCVLLFFVFFVHVALPICRRGGRGDRGGGRRRGGRRRGGGDRGGGRRRGGRGGGGDRGGGDRRSRRLSCSHRCTSYGICGSNTNA